MKRNEIYPKAKSSSRCLAVGVVLKLVWLAACGQAQTVAGGGDLDGAPVWQNSMGTVPTPSLVGALTFFSADSPANTTPSPLGEALASAGTGDATDSGAALTLPLEAAPAPTSPELLVAGTLGLMLAGWWRIRRLEL